MLSSELCQTIHIDRILFDSVLVIVKDMARQIEIRKLFDSENSPSPAVMRNLPRPCDRENGQSRIQPCKVSQYRDDYSTGGFVFCCLVMRLVGVRLDQHGQSADSPRTRMIEIAQVLCLSYAIASLLAFIDLHACSDFLQPCLTTTLGADTYLCHVFRGFIWMLVIKSALECHF